MMMWQQYLRSLGKMARACLPVRNAHATVLPAQRGFSLAEVLIAVAILLVGVLVALRIFPTGFDLFNEAQQTHQALKLLHQALANFDEDRQGLPDAILPVDYTANGQNWQASAQASATNYYTLTQAGTAALSMSSAVVTQNTITPSSQWLMGYLNAVDYEATATNAKLYPYLAPDKSWPLWEPPSVRAMRRIIGERCQIPSAVYLMSPYPGSTAVNVSMLPSYVPRFAPVVSNGHFISGAFQPEADPVIIYDLRYKRVSPKQLQGLLNNYNQLSDHLYYAVDYANQQLQLLPDVNNWRNIRLAFYYLNASNISTLSGPSVITLQPSTTMSSLVSVTLSGQNSLLPINSIIIPGSEQLNRAYARLSDANFQNQGSVNSGQYYVPGFSSSPSSPSTTLNSLYFSQADGGRVIKIDYTAADWNILHEDLEVDKDGFVTLGLPDPKIVNIPDYPLEPNTLTVGVQSKYGAMQNDGYDVVLQFVDLSTGVTYPVSYQPGPIPSYFFPSPTGVPQGKMSLLYLQDPMAKFYPVGPDAVDLSQAHQGRVRLGSATLNSTSPYSALAGRKYRIFYRARNNWSLQVYKPPSAFWQMSGNVLNYPQYNQMLNQLGWSGFYANTNQLYVPAVYQGQSVAVDYVYQPELCRSVNDAASGTTTLFVNNSLPVTPTMLLQINNPFNPAAPSMSTPSYAVVSASNSALITLANAPINMQGQTQPISYGAFIYGYNPLTTTTLTSAGTLVQVNSTAALRAGMTVFIVSPNAPVVLQTTVIQQLVNNQQFLVSAAMSVTAGAYIYCLQNAAPLQHASGEQHLINYNPTFSLWHNNIAYPVGAIVQPTIPNGCYYTCTIAGTSGATQPVWLTNNGAQITDGGVTWSNNNSITPYIGSFRLDHLPALSSAISVRGVSVTVRALWMQPRHGSAWLYDNTTLLPPNEHLRALNERWQAKTLTAIMPEARN